MSYKNEGPLWTEVLAGRLSPFAVETFDRIGGRRSAEIACDPERLRVLLSELGLPVFPAILDYESNIGGVAETIMKFQRRVCGREPLGGGSLWIREGRPLLPIGRWGVPVEDEDGDEEILDDFIDETGTIYEGVGHDGPVAIAESYLVRMEVAANNIVLDEHRFAEREPRQWTHLMEVINARFGRRLAGVLGVPGVEAATDRYGGIWRNPELFISHRRSAQRSDHTSIYMTDFERAVSVLRTVYELWPKAEVHWHGGGGGRPALGDTIVDRLPLYDFQRQEDGEIMLIQGPAGTRLHQT